MVGFEGENAYLIVWINERSAIVVKQYNVVGHGRVQNINRCGWIEAVGGCIFRILKVGGSAPNLVGGVFSGDHNIHICPTSDVPLTAIGIVGVKIIDGYFRDGHFHGRLLHVAIAAGVTLLAGLLTAVHRQSGKDHEKKRKNTVHIKMVWSKNRKGFAFAIKKIPTWGILLENKQQNTHDFACLFKLLWFFRRNQIQKPLRISGLN